MGEITLNELDDYLAGKVSRTAEKVHSVKQTPTRLQGPGATADVIVRLQPVHLKRLLDELAEQMDVLIRRASPAASDVGLCEWAQSDTARTSGSRTLANVK